VVIDSDIPGNGHKDDGRLWFAEMIAQHDDEWLETLRQRTPSGGTHFFFQMPSELISNSAGELAPGVDVRGEGGMVLIAPSRCAGEPYEWLTPLDHPILPLPAWLLEALLEIEKGRQAHAVTSDEPIPQGQRHGVLLSLGGSMRAKSFDAGAITAALLATNNSRCTPPLPESEVRKLAQDIAERYQPNSPPVIVGQGPSGTATANTIVWSAQTRVLAGIEPKTVSWMWEPRIPFDMLTMLTGDPGVGKSYIALAKAAEFTRDGGTVLYLTVENDPAYVLRPRFTALGGDASRFHLLEGRVCDVQPTPLPISLTDVDILTDAVKTTGAKLIVVDPLQSYLGAKVDAHRSNETRPILDGLVRIAREHQAAVLLLRHASKAGGNRAIHRGLGSIDFTAAVRSELFAGTTQDGRRGLVHIKSNVGPIAPALGYEITAGDPEGTVYAAGFFRWLDETEITAADLVQPDSESGDRIAEAKEFLEGLLRDGPQSVKTLQRESRAAGLAWRTVERAKTQLAIRAHQPKGQQHAGWEWILPKDKDYRL
jgi:hypothetical protein